MKRSLITILAIILGLAFVGGMFYSASRLPEESGGPPEATETTTKTDENVHAPAVTDAKESAKQSAADPQPSPQQAARPDAPPTQPELSQPAPAAVPQTFERISGLTVQGGDYDEWIEFGSDNPASAYRMKVVFNGFGAGIQRITLSQYREFVGGNQPYVVIGLPLEFTGASTPFIAKWVWINDEPVSLADTKWQVQGPVEDADGVSVTFRAPIVDAAGKPVIEIVRTWRLAKSSYDLSLGQRIMNKTGEPVSVAFEQNGQGDMIRDPAAYLGERREYVTGYFQPQYDPDKLFIYTKGAHLNRSNLASDRKIWPNPALGGNADKYKLAWIASENRYFAVVVHPEIAPDTTDTASIPYFTQTFPRIGVQVSGADEQIMLSLTRSTQTLPGGESLDLGFSVYAGPRDKEVLSQPPYKALFLSRLVRYNIGGMCSFCTFQWLAEILIGFMRWIHWVTGDWGMAIIVLVICVRLLLHPITKRAQINMMKMGKQMAALQPEIEKIKKKYKDDQQKLNAEMMKLYREKGVNPAGFLGCLPMLLQTPIWIALYAMLYFAIELRHEPAFYGVFQAISGGHWHFLQDLSVSDNFIRFISPDQPGLAIPFVSGFLGPIRALNILPLLMAVVFYINQKFTTPPPANEQQAQQQKIMKFMVLIFPVFLYNAPSGLTLYIFTSTLFGILDGYMVRKHIKELEDRGHFDPANSGGKGAPKKPKPGGFMDRMTKALEQKQLGMQQKQRESAKPPQRGGKGGGSGKKRKR